MESKGQRTKGKELEQLCELHAPCSAFHAYSCFKHIGIYSYRKDILLKLAGLPPSGLEQIEKLEQLRALENGFKIKVRETFSETSGVDTPEDLERIEKWLNTSL